MDEHAEIERLQAKVVRLNADLQRAAQLGLDLLNEKNALAERFSSQQADSSCAAELEALREEVHRLRGSLQTKERVESAAEAEWDALNGRLRDDCDARLSQLGKQHAANVAALRAKLETVHDEQQAERDARAAAECELARWRAEAERLRQCSRLSDDSLGGDGADALRVELSRLTQEHDLTVDQLAAALSEVKALRAACLQQRGVIESCEEQIQDQNEMNKTSRAEIAELKDQVADLHNQLSCATSLGKPASKGNSMFQEMNDQRLKAEYELIQMKRRNDDLQSEMKALTDENRKQKQQIANALQLAASRPADGGSDRAALADELSRVRAELRAANGRLQRQSNVGHRESAPNLARAAAASDADSSLRELAAQLRRDLAAAQDRARQGEMDKMDLGDQLIVEKRRCGDLERAAEAAKADCIQLQMKLDEARRRQRQRSPSTAEMQRPATVERIPFAVNSAAVEEVKKSVDTPATPSVSADKENTIPVKENRPVDALPKLRLPRGKKVSNVIKHNILDSLAE